MYYLLFFLCWFQYLSLYLFVVGLINMCLSVFLLEFILYGTLHFLYLGDCFPMLGKFSTSNIFSGPFPFSSSSGTSIMQMLVCLMLSQRSLRLSSLFSPLTFFSFFFLYIVLSQWFPPLWLSIHFFFLYASVILLSIPSSVLFISVIMLFISVV